MSTRKSRQQARKRQQHRRFIKRVKHAGHNQDLQLGPARERFLAALRATPPYADWVKRKPREEVQP